MGSFPWMRHNSAVRSLSSRSLQPSDGRYGPGTNSQCPIADVSQGPQTKALPSSGSDVRVRTKDKYRMVYRDEQRLELEKEFCSNNYITAARKAELAEALRQFPLPFLFTCPEANSNHLQS